MAGSDWCGLREEGPVLYCEKLSWKAPVFRDRSHAGRVLAALVELADIEAEAVYALAKGGVPVAAALAVELGLPLDVIVVKKVNYPWTTEAGYGAVAPDGTTVLDPDVAPSLEEYTARRVGELVEEARRLTLLLRGSLDYSWARGRRILLVDDGIATGYTMAAAAVMLERLGAAPQPSAPTASRDGARRVHRLTGVGRVAVVNLRCGPYYAVADAYMEWHDVSVEEARRSLEWAWSRVGRPPAR